MQEKIYPNIKKILTKLKPLVKQALFEEIHKITKSILSDSKANTYNFQRLNNLIHYSDKNQLLINNILNHNNFLQELKTLIKELLKIRNSIYLEEEKKKRKSFKKKQNQKDIELFQMIF